MNTTTLQDLQNNLPIPSEKGRQSFTFKTWRLPEEKKIAEIRNRNKNLGKFVREAFEFMLDSFDGQKWDSVDQGQKKLIINQMPFANVFYMWIYLRYDALGEALKMAPINCPHCDGEVKDFIADLRSLEVKCAGLDDEGNELKQFEKTFDYQLKKPVTIGDLTVKALRVGFTPWDAMEKLAANERNFGSIKESMMRYSLIGALAEESKEVVTTLQKNIVLDSLSKKDIEGYYDAIDKHNGGPVLAMTIPCPHCGKDFVQPLNWTYEYFFGNSSL